jgi:4-diphosphocytidyl-2-C-methyl-D-erythritol kinase
MKNTITVNAFAKINIALWVKEKRQDGFHEINTLMQTISLADTLTLKETIEPGIRLFSDNNDLPLNEDNLIYKAAQAFCEHYEIEPHLAIKVDKRIPIAGGLAGGSSDAAGTLCGLSKLYHKSINVNKEIFEIAASLGSDIPFVLKGGLATATGRGEKLTLHKPPRKPYTVVIAVPHSLQVSTKWAYENYTPFDNDAKERANNLILKAYQEGDFTTLRKVAFNDLERVTLEAYPEVLRVKEALARQNNGLVLMSGSGPAIFGLFKDKKEALLALKNLHGMPVKVFIEQTMKKNF